MLLRTLAILAQIAAATACGGANPSVPRALTDVLLIPTPLPQEQWLRPGRYSVFIGGGDFDGRSFEPICTPPGTPPAGKFVNTEIDLVADGDGLVGHAVSSDVDLEIRLQDGGPNPVVNRGRLVVGEIRG